MDDKESTSASRRTKSLAGAVGLLLAGGIAGGALATTSSASAADSRTSPAAAAAAATPGAPPSGRPADTATTVRAGEKALTGADFAKAKSAPVKAVPGGTAYRLESDVDGATYEAHMTKADGTHVTVKFDKSFNVTAIQNGRHPGGPGGPDGGPPVSPSGAGV